VSPVKRNLGTGNLTLLMTGKIALEMSGTGYLQSMKGFDRVTICTHPNLSCTQTFRKQSLVWILLNRNQTKLNTCEKAVDLED
jgi:hypothetical protein